MPNSFFIVKLFLLIRTQNQAQIEKNLSNNYGHPLFLRKKCTYSSDYHISVNPNMKLVTFTTSILVSKLSRTTRSPGYLWDFRQDHVGIYKLPHSFRFFVVAGVSKEYETDATKSSHVNPTMLRAESA